jgi:ABC-type glutathione transport system ATPase component
MTTALGQDPVLSARELSKSYVTQRDLIGRPSGSFSALKAVNLALFKGETVALVGESGSGKSTLARCMLRLVQPSSGSVYFGDIDVLTASRSQLMDFRRHVQIVFQDPFGSLDPRLRIGTSIAEGMRHLGLTSAQSRARCIELLELVQLSPRVLDRYPHEFSGGQRQRISIARALGPNPSVLLADEPVSALDVSVQGTILNLLRDLQDKLGLTYLIITHDLSVVRNISDRVAVMYQGALVENAPADEFFDHPQHPHSRELIAAAPSLELRSRLHATRQPVQPARPGGTAHSGEEP